jgi:hypothetical protein
MVDLALKVKKGAKVKKDTCCGAMQMVAQSMGQQSNVTLLQHISLVEPGVSWPTNITVVATCV